MKFLRLWIISFLLISALEAEPIKVAIQPLGPVKQEDIERVKSGISALYQVEVEVLPRMPMPESAYYKPRDRYKADGLLDALENSMDARFAKVLGLTAKDISITNDEGNDWGIFGLGQLGGRTCVVSTFRLRAKKASDELFHARLVKVVNHELGHAFGLEHCPEEGCFMRDAGGKIATVDAETGKPCANCSVRLPLVK